MLDSIEVLGLRGATTGTPADRLRGLIERMLVLAADRPEGVAAGADVSGRIAQLRTSARNAVGLGDLVLLGEAALAMCAKTVEAHRRERLGTSSELAAILVAIRDAMATVAGEAHGYSSDVTSSVARLESLQRIPDLHELKRHLIAEVQELKTLAAEREHRWRATVAGFEQRVSTLERQVEERTALATVDPLTGVDNRRGIEAKFLSLKSHARTLVLALLDLDDFKVVNDTHGHPVGDEVLVAVATALRASVRSDDVVGRVGGDEFVLLLDGLTLRQAESRMKSLLDAVRLGVEALRTSTGAALTLTACCGIAELSAGDTLASLLQRADGALYGAKRLGKGRVLGKEAPFMRDLMNR